MDWNVVDRRMIYDASPWLRLWMEDIQLPDGRIVDDFASLDMPDYVVVVAMTPERDVVTTHSYKHGPRRESVHLPAGFIEPNEKPPLAARRELLEETGYEASEWESLGSFATDGNRGAGTGHLFLAHDARKVAEPDSGDLEEMTIELMSLDALLQATRNGDVAVLAIAAAIGLAAARLAAR